MKKTFLILGLTLLAGVVVAHCGGDSTGGGGDATNPSTAVTEFGAPTGTITNDNATDVINSTLDTTNGEAVGGLMEGLPIPGLGKLVLEKSFRKFKPGFRAQGNVDSCVSGDNTSATIDMGCLADLPENTGCTASGTVSFAVDGAMITIDINNVSMACPADDINVTGFNGQLAFLFNEDLSAPTAAFEMLIVCVNVTATLDGSAESFNGCVGVGGDYADRYLVNGSGGSVVVYGVFTDATCGKVCGDFGVSGGDTVSVMCDISALAGSCGNDPTDPDWTRIETVAGCELVEACTF